MPIKKKILKAPSRLPKNPKIIKMLCLQNIKNNVIELQGSTRKCLKLHNQESIGKLKSNYLVKSCKSGKIRKLLLRNLLELWDLDLIKDLGDLTSSYESKDLIQ